MRGYSEPYNGKQQEPRILAHISRDPNLLAAYAQNKDLYAWMASIVYQLPYDECLEFRDGKENPEGKKRRDSMKILVLALMYGRGVDSTAEQLHVTKKAAQKIIDTFFNEFPSVKATIEDVQKGAREKGYVKTVSGRKRRLFDMQLPPFEILNGDGTDPNDEIADYFYARLVKARYYRDVLAIKDEAVKMELRVIDNRMKIADAERQCLNSVIQGSAADVTKIAMLELWRNARLNEIGFKMLVTVHDEIIGEAPIEHALEAESLLERIMIDSVADFISVPMKVDTECSDRWTGNSIKSTLSQN